MVKMNKLTKKTSTFRIICIIVGFALFALAWVLAPGAGVTQVPVGGLEDVDANYTASMIIIVIGYFFLLAAAANTKTPKQWYIIIGVTAFIVFSFFGTVVEWLS